MSRSVRQNLLVGISSEIHPYCDRGTMPYYVRAEFTTSAIAWIPYTFFQFYLFREHLARSRNLQSNILFFLAAGSVFRCAWFWVDWNVYYVISEVINRIALLLQFSGISLLMLMWSRAIAISKMTDAAYNESAQANAVENGRDTVLVDTGKLRLQRYREATQAVMARLTGMSTFHNYIFVTIIVNIMVWGFVLGSLASDTDLWYNINIIGISMACLVAAAGTLFVGLWVSVALHAALSPVYVSNQGSTTYSQDQRLKCVCMGKYGAGCETLLGCCGLCSLYAFIFNYRQAEGNRQGLQMQREVLKVILSVSTITSFFFLIRSICFMYRPIIKEDAGATEYSGAIDDALYPFFFYQVPEFIPNMVIALGISPPNGVLRIAFAHGLHWYRVAADIICCGYSEASVKLKNAQQSVFDSEFASMSPAARPSYLAETAGGMQAPGAAVAPSVSAAGARPHTPPFVTAPTSSSAPIAIPLGGGSRRPMGSGITSSSSQRDLDKQGAAHMGGQQMERPEQHAVKEDVVEAADVTISPVHATGAVSMEDGLGGSSSSSPNGVSDQTSAAPASMQRFQVEGADAADQAGRKDRGSKGSGSFRNFVGSIITRSTNSNSIGTRPGSTRGSRGSSRRASTGSAHQPQGEEEGDEDDLQWDRQRRDSAEMAEMLYRINSFSTGELTSAVQTLASSLTSSAGSRAVSGARSSVDSNTIMNSRRHNIENIVGGNRSLSPAGRPVSPAASSPATPGKGSSRWGWFG